jgi:hypothetical protein
VRFTVPEATRVDLVGTQWWAEYRPPTADRDQPAGAVAPLDATTFQPGTRIPLVAEETDAGGSELLGWRYLAGAQPVARPSAATARELVRLGPEGTVTSLVRLPVPDADCTFGGGMLACLSGDLVGLRVYALP